jgi:DNA modification methylase
MTPYYHDEAHNIVLFEGDVLDVTAWLATRENWPSQVITVTDPPYNVGMDYGPEVDDNRELDVYMNWTDAWFQAVPRPLVLTPGVVNFEMWAAYIEWPTAIIPWLKPNQSSPSNLGGFNVWEPVLLYGKPPNRLGHDAIIMPIGQQAEVQGRRWYGGQATKRHPCPKYLPFWLKLIGNVWKPGWTIYDPFVGSGTSALACKRLGIPFVGADIKREYLDLTVERLQQEVMDLPEVEVDDTANYKLAQRRFDWPNHPNGVRAEAEVEA